MDDLIEQQGITPEERLRIRTWRYVLDGMSNSREATFLKRLKDENKIKLPTDVPIIDKEKSGFYKALIRLNIDYFRAILPEEEGEEPKDDRADYREIVSDEYWKNRFSRLSSVRYLPGGDISRFRSDLPSILDSVVAIIHTDKWESVQQSVGSVKTLAQAQVIKYSSIQNLKGFCGKYSDEPSIVKGTAFLIGPDLLLTAGHNFISSNGNWMTADEVSKLRFIFDYRYRKGESVIQPNRMTALKGALVPGEFENFENFDWALIRLEKPIPNRRHFVLSNTLSKTSRLYTAGFPSGIPMKFTPGGRFISSTSSIFKTSLDTFSGNSGSPIVNIASGEVEGILLRGENDYILNSDRCLVEQKYRNSQVVGGHAGEKCQTIVSIRDRISKYLTTT